MEFFFFFLIMILLGRCCCCGILRCCGWRSNCGVVVYICCFCFGFLEVLCLRRYYFFFNFCFVFCKVCNFCCWRVCCFVFCWIWVWCCWVILWKRFCSGCMMGFLRRKLRSRWWKWRLWRRSMLGFLNRWWRCCCIWGVGCMFVIWF